MSWDAVAWTLDLDVSGRTLPPNDGPVPPIWQIQGNYKGMGPGAPKEEAQKVL